MLSNYRAEYEISYKLSWLPNCSTVRNPPRSAAVAASRKSHTRTFRHFNPIRPSVPVIYNSRHLTDQKKTTDTLDKRNLFLNRFKFWEMKLCMRAPCFLDSTLLIVIIFVWKVSLETVFFFFFFRLTALNRRYIISFFHNHRRFLTI